MNDELNRAELTDDEQVLQSLQQDLADLQGGYYNEYDRMKNDLKYESGDQWKDKADRGNRPTLTVNYCKQYVNRIVNPYILNPTGIKLSPVDDNPAYKILDQELKNLEEDSEAAEAYQTAFRHAVTCGRGWIYIEPEYKNDQSTEQKLRIKAPIDPCSVYIDRFSKEIDGYDANFGIIIEYIPLAQAKREYGPDVMAATIDPYSEWACPDDSVPVVKYYVKASTKKKRQFLVDGSYIDSEEPHPDAVVTRYIDKHAIKVYQIIGTKIISKGELNMPCIPIAPVYGNRIYTDSGIEHAGIIMDIRGTQDTLNYLASSEMELIGNAPKAPWVMAEGQIEGYAKYWKTANRKSWDALIYKAKAIGGVLLPKPERVDNSAQTQGLVASKQALTQDFARETGIFDNMLGQQEIADQSAIALRTRNAQGEIATASFTDNLFRSLKQVGRIAVYYMRALYDTERTIEVEGNKVKYLFEELPIDWENIKYDIETGPMMESRRVEGLLQLQEIAARDPELGVALSDLMVENMTLSNKSEVLKRVKAYVKLKFPNLIEEEKQAMDPEAKQALDAAQQTIQNYEQQAEYLMGVIKQLQAAIIDDDKDRQNELAKEEIKAQASLAETQIKAETDIQKEQIKAGVAVNTTAAQIVAQNDKEIRDIIVRTQQEQGAIVPEELDEMQKVAPMVEGPVSMPELGEEDDDEVLPPI